MMIAGISGRGAVLKRYGFAAAVVLALYLMRGALAPWLGDSAQFLAFVLPVAVAALFLGTGPAVLATTVALLAGFSFFPPARWGSPQMLAQTVLFLLEAAAIIWLSGRLRHEQQVSEQRGRRAECEALRAEEAGEGLRLLLEGATDYAIFTVRPDSRIASWNSGSKGIFGWTEEEAIGRECGLFYPPEDQASGKPKADLAQALAEDGLREEGWQVRKDGSEFLAEITITPIRGTDGNLRGFAKVIHDITDRRAAERALQKRERHLESILATVPDAMIVIDERGTMISFSAAAERLFGFRQDETVGRNVSMLMPSPDRERHDSYIERYLSTGEPRIIGLGRIVTGLRADGSTFPMKLSVGEVRDEEGRVFTGFVQDLTEKRDFEARLEELKSELIHVSRLSAMGTMASTLAHELNQPLTAIATYGEAAGAILGDDAEIDRALLREVFADMAAQSLRAGAIVRRLREFISRGEVAKTLENLPNLINEASALALVGSRERGITTRFDFAADATTVLADRVQIQQVLINLIRNAIEAMETCPLKRLSVTTKLLDPDTVQVSVSDSGVGISPEVEDQLFQAFASTKSSGMGLGLSISRTIIEGHGGRIRAVPGEDGGTEFQFTLVRPTPEASDG